MKVYNSLSEIKSVTHSVITVGMLDGVHLGHKKILSELVREAHIINGTSVVITFWPHPHSVVSQDPTFLLNTLEEKIALFEAFGIDVVVVQPFTREFSSLSPEYFIEKKLYPQLQFKTFIVGYDHHFGKDRHGDFNIVKQFSKKLHYKSVQVSALTIDGVNVSSTKIRKALTDGNIQLANKYLGYDYSITGTVIKGDCLGHTMGFPTANLQPAKEKIIPALGVYAVRVFCKNGSIHSGMLNIGHKPTVNKIVERTYIEVNIFDFSRNIYGESLTISLVEKIRDEKKFDNIDALRTQIEKDKIRIQKIMG